MNFGAGRGGRTLTVFDYQRLDQQAMAELARNGWQPDYVAVRRQADLRQPTERDRERAVVAAA